jgi:excisionase family DNA binding protein
MKSPARDPLNDPDRDPLKPFTVADLCRVTGWSKPTVYGAIENGTLPGYQSGPGGRWFVPAEAFRALLAGTWVPQPRQIVITVANQDDDTDDDPDPHSFLKSVG